MILEPPPSVPSSPPPPPSVPSSPPPPPSSPPPPMFPPPPPLPSVPSSPPPPESTIPAVTSPLPLPPESTIPAPPLPQLQPPESTISTHQVGSFDPSSSTRNRRGPEAGLAAGTVVLVAVLVLSLILFLVRRRRRRQEGDVDPPQQKSSPSSLLESQSKRIGEELKGSSTPREKLKLSFLQSPKIPASKEIRQLPDSQLHSKLHSSTSTSSSVSTGDHLSLVSVGVRTFTYQELSQATNQFSQDKFLGQGGFGSVYLGVLAGDGGSVAIKKLKGGSFQGEREFVTEINVISRVHHRNLVSLVGYCISGPERMLVYEYVENNNLSFHLRGFDTVLDWATRMSIAVGAAKGIAYLHEECYPRIIHRDIKSNNILLDSKFRAKVADFGLARFVPDDKTHVTTRIIGTFGYVAPEYGSSGRLTEKSDVFSFGVVLLELITGRQPINLVEWASPLLEQALEDGKFEAELTDPKLADNYDYEQMNRMVTCAAICVHRFPDHRPRMSQVVHVLEGNISPEKLKAETSKPRMRRPAA